MDEKIEILNWEIQTIAIIKKESNGIFKTENYIFETNVEKLSKSLNIIRISLLYKRPTDKNVLYNYMGDYVGWNTSFLKQNEVV